MPRTLGNALRIASIIAPPPPPRSATTRASPASGWGRTRAHRYDASEAKVGLIRQLGAEALADRRACAKPLDRSTRLWRRALPPLVIRITIFRLAHMGVRHART